MYGKLFSACLYGVNGVLIEVEVDLSNGLPQTYIVGLPDSAVREAIDRVRSAIKNCNFTYPMQRMTINLAPADLRKEGAALDLAIAVGILVASGQLVLPNLEKLLIIGELSLNGTLRPLRGVLPMVDLAKQKGFTAVLVPTENTQEALLIEGIEVYGINHLSQLITDSAVSEQEGFKRQAVRTAHQPAISSLAHLKASSLINQNQSKKTLIHEPQEDYLDVLGQHHVKRALTICAAGMHNILLMGPPGTGKTMLIKRLPSILPPLTNEQALEVTKIYSSAGRFNSRDCQFISERPFRAPHHTISASGLVGGGSIPKPGEISLAHHGVLFLDELPEFKREALEVLRQPLEEHHVTISRSKASFTFPAQFLLAASLNPCPCGYYLSEPPLPVCTCTPYRISQYREKISGPLLDRIDMQVEVPRPTNLQTDPRPLGSAEMRETVLRAVKMQATRYSGTSYRYNSELSGRAIRELTKVTTEAYQLLNHSFEALGLSMRAYDRIIKLARTIADLEQHETVEPAHIAEAIQYRQLDQQR